MGEHADDAVDRYAIHGYFSKPRSPYRQCRYCGMRGLVFKKTPTGFRLHGPTGVLHLCAEYRPKDSR